MSIKTKLPISHEDFKNMTFTDLNNQKSFLSEKYNKQPENFKDETDKTNIDNINKEINARYTKYALIAGVGIIVGMIVLRKFS